jgi:hypothetical protein
MLQVHVRVQLSHIISQKNAMSTTIENFCDALEWFLPSSIPNLELKRHVLDFNENRSEFYSDSNFVVIREFIMAHPMHKAWFANTRVTNHDKFE